MSCWFHWYIFHFCCSVCIVCIRKSKHGKGSASDNFIFRKRLAEQQSALGKNENDVVQKGPIGGFSEYWRLLLNILFHCLIFDIYCPPRYTSCLYRPLLQVDQSSLGEKAAIKLTNRTVVIIELQTPQRFEFVFRRFLLIQHRHIIMRALGMSWRISAYFSCPCPPLNIWLRLGLPVEISELDNRSYTSVI